MGAVAQRTWKDLRPAPEGICGVNVHALATNCSSECSKGTVGRIARNLSCRDVCAFLCEHRDHRKFSHEVAR